MTEQNPLIIPRLVRGIYLLLTLILSSTTPTTYGAEIAFMECCAIKVSKIPEKDTTNKTNPDSAALYQGHGMYGVSAIEGKFKQLQTNPTALYAFLKAMPKGGELHYHIEGGAYPETMLKIAAEGNYCLDPNTSTISKKKASCVGDNLDSARISLSTRLYKKTLEAWSMQNFKAGHESAHDHFFASFNKFIALIENNYVPFLASIMQRAASQHELYMEIMIMTNFKDSIGYLKKEIVLKAYSRLHKQLLAFPRFQKEAAKAATLADNLLPKTRQYLGCDTRPKQEVCQLKVAFQYYVLRDQPLDKVFQQTAFAFALAAQSKATVGVNLVAPEDGPISMRDYLAQMQIFRFFHKEYPGISIDLHAGELSSALKLSPESYHSHILDAIAVGGAKRIGHGVDVALENHASVLLDDMAKQHIAVEINLTSNQSILQVAFQDHPLRTYLKHKVPVVLSTDDEGILRTNLTHEYYKAVTEHHLSYAELKQINRNALTYSFLPGKSLWQDADSALLVNECKTLQSLSCQKWVASSEKAKMQRVLELQLLHFEHKFSIEF